MKANIKVNMYSWNKATASIIQLMWEATEHDDGLCSLQHTV